MHHRQVGKTVFKLCLDCVLHTPDLIDCAFGYDFLRSFELTVVDAKKRKISGSLIETHREWRNWQTRWI